MARAELRLNGLPGSVQTLELMGTDFGESSAGLDPALPGSFPVGQLSIGPGATVEPVDNHDNDNLGQGNAGAIYVEHLFVDTGATLNTNGSPIYVVTSEIDGTVDDPDNLHPIPELTPGDGDYDCDVDLIDFSSFQICFTGEGNGPLDAGCDVFDLDGDGDVGLVD